MNTQEDAEDKGNMSMGCGCASGIVFWLWFIGEASHGTRTTLGEFLAFAVCLAFVWFLAGVAFRVSARWLPTRDEVAKRKAAEEKTKRQEAAKRQEAEKEAVANAQRERERLAWEAGRPERERRLAEARLRQENEERLRQEEHQADILRRRQTPPEDF